MRSARRLPVGLLLILSLGASDALADSQPLRFRVWHKHRVGRCEGLLRMDGDAVAYETSHARHARHWLFRDIRHVEILDPSQLIIRTYGKPKAFDFRLREGEIGAEAYRLLAEGVGRGLTSRVLFPRAQSRFELPAKHNHRRGGCEGLLRIGPAEIVYDTERAEDRRLWRMQDVRSFGISGPFNLRLTTELETFTFDLKQALPQAVYDHLWKAIF